MLLALGQLADPAMLRLLLKTVAVTLGLFLLLGWAGWHALDWGLAEAGLTDGQFSGASEARGAAALVLTLLGGWLLWRIVALAVIGYYADEVVQAVEARHYPAAAARARDLTVPEQLKASLAGAGTALLVNLAVLPLALVLLVTGVGTALLFWLVNACLIGRELNAMVWLRHRHTAGARSPLCGRQRFALGAATAALLLVPLANFLAPLLGAAGSTHLIHRQETARNA